MKTKALLFVMLTASFVSANAGSRPHIYINEDVTTHIIMPENIKLVDLSTTRVAGDQCADNMLRIKPVTDSLMMAGAVAEGGFLGAVTIIGERHMVQYDLLYTSNPMQSETLLKVAYDKTDNYTNPDVAMTEAEMANYAWAISNTGRKFNAIRCKAFGIEAQIYNIYSIGNYFFLDLNLNNRTNIRYDIAQMRITLSDKKETKATNSQTLELTPSYVLNKETSFKKNYRQVVVLPKLTYPEEKVLNIEITEDQISGRVITIPIQYEDILHADCFDGDKLEAYLKTQRTNENLNKVINNLNKKLADRQQELDKANVKLNNLKGKLQKKSHQYLTISKKLARVKSKLEKFFPGTLADLETKDSEEFEIMEYTESKDLLTLDE